MSEFSANMGTATVQKCSKKESAGKDDTAVKSRTAAKSKKPATSAKKPKKSDTKKTEKTPSKMASTAKGKQKKAPGKTSGGKGAGKKKPSNVGSRQRMHTKAMQYRFLEALVNNRFCIYKACKAAGIGRQSFYDWKKIDAEFREKYEDVLEARIDAWEAALHRNIMAGSDVSIIFGLKTKGRRRGYGDKPMPSKEAVVIITDLLAETITTKEAAYRLYMIGEKIPDAMKIELEKTPVPEPEPDLPPAIEDDELERKYQEQMAKQDQQRDTWLPGRREEVKAIKGELKDQDSFSPEAVKETNR